MGSQSVQYAIDTKPDLKGYWVSNMEFFLFGQISSSNAQIEAGFYTEEGDLRLNVNVDCKAGTWQTHTQNTTSEKELRHEGTLDRPCEAGPFDFTYELQQSRRGKFMFNGQHMEGELEPKMKTTRGKSEESGVYRISKLNTNLKEGVQFKAEIIGDGSFTRYAYGKCTAFPNELKSNCTQASLWMKSRSKLVGEVMVNDKGTGVFGAGEHGAWVAGYDVKCWDKAPQYFFWVQSGVHSDEASGGYPYCCCMHMTGALGECYTQAELGGSCSITCPAYIDHEIFDPIVATLGEGDDE